MKQLNELKMISESYPVSPFEGIDWKRILNDFRDLRAQIYKYFTPTITEEE